MKEILKNLKYTKNDIPSGLVVFLVALPLCLGIALASGAPLFSGVITGIVGGIVTGFLSGSRFSVSGPAAGLTVIVLNAITELGSYEIFIVAVTLAGVIQLIMGYVKAGVIGMYFPTSVIRGMLAAIGLILILKQLPHFFGFDEDAFGEMSFMGTDGRNTFEEFAYALTNISMGAFIAGVLSLLVMIIWDNNIAPRFPKIKVLPGALLGVLVGVSINEIFKAGYPEWAISSSHLVSLPNLSDPQVFQESFYFPDFSQITNPLVIKTAFVIAIIASLETLLSLEAVDKLDPHKRLSPKNRELKAQGVGNIIAGLIGGLPMTAVIVRSSANIGAGAKTKMSTIYHGIMLVIAVMVIPHILNLIPLATLAAILLVVGYKLTRPAMYRQLFRNGLKQFLPFIVTIVAILLTDLLVGILIGMGVAIYFILRANFKTPYFYTEEEHPINGNKRITLTLSEHVSFLNKAHLRNVLSNVPKKSELIIDGSKTDEIDFDALVIIEEFKERAEEKEIKLKLKNIPSV